MTNQRMPIESATITVTGEGASGTPVQVYDAKGPIAGTEGAFAVPPQGSFVLDIVTQYVMPFETQTLGGGSPEWITLEDVTNGGTVAAMRVKGTVPQGVSGGVTFTVNGVYGDATYTFPDDDTPISLAIESSEEPAEVEGITYPDGGPVGAGFLNLRRLIMHADTLAYQSGGIVVPEGFQPLGTVGVSAKGGATAWYDSANRKVVLYRDGTELSGTVEDVTLIILGHRGPAGREAPSAQPFFNERYDCHPCLAQTSPRSSWTCPPASQWGSRPISA